MYFCFIRVFLTSTENEKRCRGTRLLAEVLHRLPQNQAVEKEGEENIFYYTFNTVTRNMLMSKLNIN